MRRSVNSVPDAKATAVAVIPLSSEVNAGVLPGFVTVKTGSLVDPVIDGPGATVDGTMMSPADMRRRQRHVWLTSTVAFFGLNISGGSVAVSAATAARTSVICSEDAYQADGPKPIPMLPPMAVLPIGSRAELAARCRGCGASVTGYFVLKTARY